MKKVLKTGAAPLLLLSIPFYSFQFSGGLFFYSWTCEKATEAKEEQKKVGRLLAILFPRLSSETEKGPLPVGSKAE